MKYLRKFNSVSDMNTALASATIDILALAYDGSTPVMRIKSGGSPVPPTPSTSTPFYVENITQQSETLTIAGYDWTEQGNYLEIPVQYSTDGTNWASWNTTGANPLTMTLQPSDKVYLRARTNTWAWYGNEGVEYGCTIYGVSKVGGNIMSLLYGSDFTGNETAFPTGSTWNFYALFNDMVNEENTVLVSASELILPATTLTNACYFGMFQYCLSLTTAPALPATTLAESCYGSMFGNCTSLTTAPALPTITLANYCYDGMFMGCEALTTAPTLPATTLVEGCYSGMFGFCTHLNHIECLATDISASDCANGWVLGVAATGTFVKNPSMSSWTEGIAGIPSGWTVQDATE